MCWWNCLYSGQRGGLQGVLGWEETESSVRAEGLALEWGMDGPCMEGRGPMCRGWHQEHERVRGGWGLSLNCSVVSEK